MEQEKEIWIFLSHSNEDYNKVRIVRNLLEEQELRPIMFFLRCLNNDDEVDALIKREIDCRTRFIYCKSENAEKSKWVQRELAYINDSHRSIETIDLSLSEDEIAKLLSEYRRRSEIFISYPWQCKEIAKKVSDLLKNFDYFVFFDIDELTVGGNFSTQLTKHIQNTSTKEGVFIYLISRNTIKNEYQKKELELYLESKSNHSIFIPIVVDDLTDKEIRESTLGPMINLSKMSYCDKPEQIVLTFLKEVFDVRNIGSLLTYADEFRKGVNRQKNIELSDLCFSIYYKKAYESPNPAAWASLGRCYENGIGTVIDLKKAEEFYTMARYDGGMSQYSEDIIRVRKKINPTDETSLRKTILKNLKKKLAQRNNSPK